MSQERNSHDDWERRTQRRAQTRNVDKNDRHRERVELIQASQWLAHGPLDIPFFLLVILLNAIGLVMLFSASFPSAMQESGNAFSYVVRQGMFMVVGFAGMLIISRINYQRLRKLATPALWGSIFLLALVLVPGLGITSNNATRWLGIPGTDFQFQPSEIVKLAVVLYFAHTISPKKGRMNTLRYGILPYAAILAVIVLLMWFQPHLSGIILIVATGGIMMLVGGIHLGWLVAAVGGAALAYHVIFNIVGYNASRIAMWKDPWLDPQDAGYQMVQSLLAIGSGGLLGVGFGKSRQKFLYLPEEQNDFIFAIVCEELGLIGASIIMLLFAALVLRGYWIALHARDRFGSLIVVGVTTLIGLQTFLNIAVVTGFIPTTGISLPFFSYGGTALSIQLASMGLILSVSRQMKPTIGG